MTLLKNPLNLFYKKYKEGLEESTNGSDFFLIVLIYWFMNFIKINFNKGGS